MDVEQAIEKAEELYKTFKTVLYSELPATFVVRNNVIKECAKACCDKICNAVVGGIGNVQYNFYQEVKKQIDLL